MRYFRYGLICIFLLATPIVQAATIEVPAGNVAALIAAIDAANASPEADVINLGGGVYTLTQVNNRDTFVDVPNDNYIGGGPNGLPVIRGNLTINGNGAVIERANNAPEFRIMLTFGNVTINDLTLQNGFTIKPSYFRTNVGGAIFNLETLAINDSTLINNWAAGGGAIFNYMATLTIRRSRITDNVGTCAGGGLFNSTPGRQLTILDTTIANNVAGTLNDWMCGYGAGIYLDTGNMTIRNSALTGNVAQDGGLGGGMYIVGDPVETLDISNNTTISGNTARLGGGIFNSAGRFTVNNITIANNTASENGGGVFAYDNEFFGFQNTIIANNQPNNCNTETDFLSEGNNLDTDGSCRLNNNDLSNVPAMLAPLGNYGGLTLTHALKQGSQAIDHGNSATCRAYDQRGLLRDSACDIGAYEAVEYAPMINYSATTTPTLSWSETTWSVGYQIEFNNASNFRGTGFFSEVISPGDLSYVTPPLGSGIWYWRVRAQRSNLTWGRWSAAQTVVVAIQ